MVNFPRVRGPYDMSSGVKKMQFASQVESDESKTCKGHYRPIRSMIYDKEKECPAYCWNDR